MVHQLRLFVREAHLVEVDPHVDVELELSPIHDLPKVIGYGDKLYRRDTSLDGARLGYQEFDAERLPAILGSEVKHLPTPEPASRPSRRSSKSKEDA